METTQDIVKAIEAAGFEIEIEAQQEDAQVEGNAVASGNDEYDAKVYAEVNRRLDNGDVWAWAAVTVRVSHPDFPGIEGTDHLGCCSYDDEADFATPDGYYPDIVREALADWLKSAENADFIKMANAVGNAKKILA